MNSFRGRHFGAGYLKRGIQRRRRGNSKGQIWGGNSGEEIREKNLGRALRVGDTRVETLGRKFVQSTLKRDTRKKSRWGKNQKKFFFLFALNSWTEES